MLIYVTIHRKCFLFLDEGARRGKESSELLKRDSIAAYAHLNKKLQVSNLPRLGY